MTGLKKNLEYSIKDRRCLIDGKECKISIIRQCELLGIPRSSYYYKPAKESPYNLLLMRLIDEQYTKCPFYGIPRMTVWLRKEGHKINHKRVERLMTKMGIHAIYPKPRLSHNLEKYTKYPYLLRGLNISRPNQVWCADITYIRLLRGFIYLVAIMDWFSRYVLSWEISNTLDNHFCKVALKHALCKGKPEIFNTDQGIQFTSQDFTSLLKIEGIKISMDGRGRTFDNIFIERLWRTVKYEEVYLNDYQGVYDAITGIRSYFKFYNHERPHQSLGYKTPASVYMENNIYSEVRLPSERD